jgi:peptidoglycan/LPS O-acetylase OafA/YrhL
MTADRYRADIDGLRGIAVLSVVAFHVAPQFWRGGFVGVDIFFVISGFLISSIICKGLDDGTFSFVDFYERRIRRIFPALIVVLLACLLLGWLVLLADEYEELGSHTKAAAGFYSNILLLRETGYFDTGAQYKILLHLWSLGIEEQFYLGWPLFLFLIWKRPAARPWAIGFVTLLSFGLNIWFLHSKPNSVFYLPFTRLWELSIGALLFETRALPGAGWPGAALVGASMLFLDGDMRFPGWWGAMPVAGSALLIWAGPDAWVNRRVLARSELVQAGLISYPLYLWHWPILCFASLLGWDRSLVCVALSLILAWLTWRFVEIKIRARRGIRSDAAGLALTMLLIGAAGIALVKSHGANWRAGSRRFEHAVGGDSASARLVDCPKRPDVWHCLQSGTGLPDAVIIGDSHGAHLLPGLAALDHERSWLSIANGGCPPALEIGMTTSAQPDCPSHVKAAFAYVATRVPAPRIAVLSFHGYYDPDRTRLKFERSGPREEVFFRGINAAVARLMGQHEKVVLAMDVPDLPFRPRDCFRPIFSAEHDCVLERRAVDQRQREYRNMIERLRQAWPRLVIFDPFPVICPEATCTPIRGEFSLYRDKTHLSLIGSRAVAKALLVAISESGPIGSRP